MKRTRLFSCLCLAATVLISPVANAAGMIFIDPVAGMPVMPHGVPVHPIGITRPGGGTPTPTPGHTILRGAVSYGLRLQDADVKVEITDQVAKTYVTQTFANETDRNLAGTYLFPLPDD